MNIIDLLIVLALLAAVFRGIKYGFVQRVFALAGFTVGLLTGAWLARYLVQEAWDPVFKLGFIFAIVVVMALSISFAAELIGLQLTVKAHSKKKKAKPVNQVMGATFEAIFILVIAWLLSSSLAHVRSYDIGEKVRESFTSRLLYKVLPPPPDVLSSLEKIITPNGFPSVFIGLEPQHTTISANNKISGELVATAEKSVVKVRGSGCGGIVEGTGFMIAENLIMTNAHVVAGIRNPEVLNSIRSYSAKPIWFDPDIDVAVLYVNGLTGEPLDLAVRELKTSEGGVVLGFPKGSELVVNEATVIDRTTAEGYNIYNTGRVFRNIYQLQAKIEHGFSGGPLINQEGSISGMVFAKAFGQDNVGYALAISNLKPIIKKTEHIQKPVYTGTCVQR